MRNKENKSQDKRWQERSCSPWQSGWFAGILEIEFSSAKAMAQEKCEKNNGAMSGNMYTVRNSFCLKAAGGCLNVWQACLYIYEHVYAVLCQLLLTTRYNNNTNKCGPAPMLATATKSIVPTMALVLAATAAHIIFSPFVVLRHQRQLQWQHKQHERQQQQLQLL